MLFIMFCELLYLTFWASVGYAIAGDELPPQFSMVPWIALGVLALFVRVGGLLPRLDRAGLDAARQPILKAFREASPLRYAAVAALRSPALLAAVIVYTLALRLFGVEATFVRHARRAARDLLRGRGAHPMRAAAITIWAVLFPEREAQMSAFGFVHAQLLHLLQRGDRPAASCAARSESCSS